jgi:hypothetical protein
MKKGLLFCLTAAVALGANAQQRVTSFAGSEQGRLFSPSQVLASKYYGGAGAGQAAKTTASPRWYSFGDYFNQNESSGSGAAITSTYLWKDTSAVMAYSDGSGGISWSHNRAVSMGLVTDPAFSGFNDPSFYDGVMKVTSTDAYVVDSIRFTGIYGFRPSNTYVDTIRVTFVYGNADRGNGTSGPDVYLAKTGNPVVLSRYGVSDSMDTYRMHFDTVTTRTFGTTAVVKDLILDNTGSSPAWGDTTDQGVFVGHVALPDVSVPAGNLIGATLTFISGSPTFFTDDTVFGSTIGYKHNMFRPIIWFRGTSGSSGPAPVFAQYTSGNRNSGMFKTLPDTSNGWGGQYIPLWFWSAGSGSSASVYQYPDIDFRVKCAPCATLGVSEAPTSFEASAYPNPATEELNVPFTLAALGSVEVTLSNTLGQTVATRKFTGVSKGKAVFNTSSLAPGVYMYTVSSEGKRASGRVAITK